MYFDTHCHLSLFSDIPSVIEKAKENAVNYILAVAMYYKDNLNVLKLAETYPEVIPALGIHPIEAPNLTNVEEKLDSLEKLILENEIGVLGELGLDRYFVKTEQAWNKQEKIFRHFLEFAVKRDLVVNLHGKYAEKELFEVLSEYNLKIVVIHWFAGAPELVQEGIKRNYFFSVTPEVFYSKRMRKLVELVPIEQLLSESDGPVKYKKPQKFVGEPALMERVVQEIATIKDLPLREVERQVYKTAIEIFLR